MADLLLENQVAASTPTTGNTVIAVNSTTKRIQTVDDAGFRRTLGMINFSTAAQSPAAATRTYIAGSGIVIPAGALQVGTCFRWRFNMTKTAAGSAASTFDIAFGTAGTTADTARVSFTKPAGTAAADQAQVDIMAICRGPVGASGIVAGIFGMIHNLENTGHAVIPAVAVHAVSAGFDITTPTNIGICLTSGASDAITIEEVLAEAWNF